MLEIIKDVEYPLALAPMEDITDVTLRLLARRRGADLVFTEFTSSEAIIRKIPKALKKIEISDQERPVGIQIFGGRESSMAQAAKIVETYQPDWIDINCGCWNKNHAFRGEGAGLLRDLPRLKSIIKEIIRSVKIPVSVKTRLGWDHKSIIILELAKMVEQLGCCALTVHCRTRAQGYKGQADWEWLEKIRKTINIPLIGNGDIVRPQDALHMFSIGCDAVMIGRAALTNPWIFHQTKHFLKTKGHLPLPSLDQRINACLEHLRLIIKNRGKRDGIIRFRKFYAGYLHDVPYGAHLRSELMHLFEYEEIKRKLLEFNKISG